MEHSCISHLHDLIVVPSDSVSHCHHSSHYHATNSHCIQVAVGIPFRVFFKCDVPRSQGFWMRTATYREQPDIHFKHKLLLTAHTASGDQIGWSTFSPVNTFLVDNVRIPSVTSREEDTNRDGILDSMDMEIRMPLRQDEEVVSVNLMLVFDVKLYTYSWLSMSGLVHVQSGGWAGSGLNVVGDINIVQKQPLAHRGRDNRSLSC